ncbi:MAG: hypothetical protein ACRDYC_01965, partial [Acidimicrobiales bacterium]
GTFTGYSPTSNAFSALYPTGWTATPEPPNGVDFSSPGGSDSVAITTATSALPQGESGYGQVNSTSAVVCGVTGNLVTYMKASTGSSTPSVTGVGNTTLETYLVQLNLALGPKEYLGVNANLSSLNDISSAQDVIYSLSFPIAQCVGAAAVPPSTTALSSTTT